MMLPTSTARRYQVPTALGASGQRIPAAIVVAVIVVAAEGAAAAFRAEVAPAVAAAAHLFLAVLLGGDPEVELLCILVQRSQRLVGCYRVPFEGRLSALWDRVDGGGGDGRRRRR